jgi:CRISPR-associated endoribonuclease Cas6
MDTFRDLVFYVYRFNLIALEQIELTRFNKGITLRGAFGTVFRSIVCHHRNSQCSSCKLNFSCPYSFIFSPIVSPEAKRLRLNHDIPRSFVFKPPQDDKQIYEAGDRFSFEFVVVGNAQKYLPYFIVTFDELGRQGIGVRRGRYRIEKIEALDEGLVWEPVLVRDAWAMPLPERPLTISDVFDNTTSSFNKIQVKFLTPVLLKNNGKWSKPYFSPMAKRLRDRISALSYFYCDKIPEMDFQEFGRKADEVTTIKDELRWIEEKRFSKHRDMTQLLKGYIGEIIFEGNITPFLPLLRMGEFLHVGKATAFGQGWYELTLPGF